MKINKIGISVNSFHIKMFQQKIRIYPSFNPLKIRIFNYSSTTKNWGEIKQKEKMGRMDNKMKVKKFNKIEVKGEKREDDDKILEEYIKIRQYDKMWDSLKKLITKEKYPSAEIISKCIKSLPKNAKKKELEEIFKKMRDRYVSLENPNAMKSLYIAMLSYNMKSRKIDEAKKMMEEMNKMGIRLEGLGLFHLVELEYIENGITESLQKIDSLSDKMDEDTERRMYISLIWLCKKKNEMYDAIHVLHEMRQKKIKIQLTVVSDVVVCCANMSNLEMVDHVLKIFFEEYQNEEQQLSFIVKTIEQQSSLNNINGIMMIYEACLKYPHISNTHSFYTVVLKSMFEHKKLNFVQIIIREMERRNVVPNTFTINTMLYGFGMKFDDVLSFEYWIDYMNENKIRSNKYTYLTIANVYERMGYKEESKQYREQYNSIEKSSTESSILSLIESGDLEKAESVIVELLVTKKKIPSTFGIFIEHLCKEGMFLKAYHYYLFLPSKFKIEFDTYSVCTLLKYCPYYLINNIYDNSAKFPKVPPAKFFPILFARCAQEKDLNQCLIYYNHMTKNSIEMNSKLFTSYLTSLLVCNDEKQAEKFYKTFQKYPFFSPKNPQYADVIWADIFYENDSRYNSFEHQQKSEIIQKSFSYLFEISCRTDNLALVEKLWEQMKKRNHPFKVREFVSLAGFCSHTGNSSKLSFLLEETEKSGQKSSVLYSALAEACCSVGDIETAQKIFQSLAFFEEKKVNRKLVATSQISIYNSFIKYFCKHNDEQNVTLWLQQAFEDNRVDCQTIFYVLQFFKTRNDPLDVEKSRNLLSLFSENHYLDTICISSFLDLLELKDHNSLSFALQILISHGFTSHKRIDDPLVKSLLRFVSEQSSYKFVNETISTYDTNSNFNAAELKRLVENIKENFC